VTTSSAGIAYKDVLTNAGTSRPIRDAVDQRTISDVKNNIGRIIDDPSQVGGWPRLAAGTPKTDTDHDGIPNAWETSHGINPSLNDSAGHRNRNGYTNIEEYINGLMR
jgi:hypothetical protein